MPTRLGISPKRAPKASRSKVKSAVDWFKGKVKGLTTVTGKRNQSKTLDIGKMYTYRYDAKWDKILPTWDRQPMVIIIEKYKDSVLTLNLHYLPLTKRFLLLRALDKVATGDLTSDKDRMKISYQILKGVASSKLYAPAIKKHLYSHIKTGYSLIHPQEWSTAIYLPTAKWVRGRPY